MSKRILCRRACPAQPHWMAAALLCAASTSAALAQVPVAVHVDRNAPAGVCRLEIGVTHTQHDLDSAGADLAAVERVRKMLPAVCRYQVEPIMGW
ncbi:MAG TPA: hypothetical protein VKT77_12305, partial [Chthonomonadaceae bacterium]|nr:hypothetical protein [Chthonomonadaceae bacterium]